MTLAVIGGLLGCLMGMLMTAGLVGSIKHSGGNEDIRGYFCVVLGTSLITFGGFIGAITASVF